MGKIPKQTYQLGDRVFWIFKTLRSEVTTLCPHCEQGQIVTLPEKIERFIIEGTITDICILRESDDSYIEVYGVESFNENYKYGYVDIKDLFPTFNVAQSEFVKRHPGIKLIMELATEEEV
jgi:hypothetical protein